MKKIPFFQDPNAVTKVGDEFVILPKAVNEKNKVGLVNETAAFIIGRIDGHNSTEEIANAICSAYDVDFDKAHDVTISFITQLFEYGICSWKEES